MNEYFIQTLDISKESAYRRINGEISFNMDEVLKIVNDWDLSLDAILLMDKEPKETEKKESDFYLLLHEYLKYIERANLSDEHLVYISMNRPELFLLSDYPNLFRFWYYKWLYQTRKSFELHFSESKLSDKEESLCRNLQETKASLNQLEYIIDNELFRGISDEIHYFWKRQLLTEEEKEILKAELHLLLAEIIQMMSCEWVESRKECNYYLSVLKVETNTIGIRCDTSLFGLTWTTPVRISVSSDGKFCTMHRRWIDSLKKCSALISCSNEMLRAEFFQKQEKYINEI